MERSLNGSLQRLNSWQTEAAETELLKCCGSREWARRMVAARPFASLSELLLKANEIWWSLAPRDWLEAFHSHPKIGEQKPAVETGAEAQRWSEEEQSGTRNSALETKAALAELNSEYERKFGFIFIVCATGKSSEEMLRNLRNRLRNGPGEELGNAATEQGKITQLRLRKLLDNQQ